MSAELHKWNLNDHIPNPPNATAYTDGLENVRAYALDMAYVPPPRSDDNKALAQTHILGDAHHGRCRVFGETAKNCNNEPYLQLVTNMAKSA
jgi:hypothetical protein